MKGALTSLAVGVVLVNSWMLVGVQGKARCQADFATAVSKLISVRAPLAERADRNQNGLLSGVARLSADADRLGREPTKKERAAGTAAFKKLLADFRTEAEKIDKERKKYQPPVIPDCAS